MALAHRKFGLWTLNFNKELMTKNYQEIIVKDWQQIKANAIVSQGG